MTTTDTRALCLELAKVIDVTFDGNNVDAPHGYVFKANGLHTIVWENWEDLFFDLQDGLLFCMTHRNPDRTCEHCSLNAPEPIAVNIYERMEMGGSVQTDLNAMVADGASWADFEDYFGDTDPTDWL